MDDAASPVRWYVVLAEHERWRRAWQAERQAQRYRRTQLLLATGGIDVESAVIHGTRVPMGAAG